MRSAEKYSIAISVTLRHTLTGLQERLKLRLSCSLHTPRDVVGAAPSASLHYRLCAKLTLHHAPPEHQTWYSSCHTFVSNVDCAKIVVVHILHEIKYNTGDECITTSPTFRCVR